MHEIIKKITDDLNNFKYKKSPAYTSMQEKEKLYTYQLIKNDVVINLGAKITTEVRFLKVFISWAEITILEQEEKIFLVDKINEMGEKLLKKYQGNVNIIVQKRLMKTAKI